MITYSWIFTNDSLDTAPSEDGLTDVVKTVHWRRRATETVEEKTYTVDSYGTMACGAPSETDFTAYPDLTEPQVVGWLEAGLDVLAIDAGLATQIENLINPTIINLPLPWANNQ